MIEGLESLSIEEQEFMLNVPVLITIMIADADNVIDEAEKDVAEKLAVIRSVRGRLPVQAYYRHLKDDFRERLKKHIDHYGATTLNSDEVIRQISADLETLNLIWNKLDRDVAIGFYQSFCSFAENIAKASGGFFKFGTISPEEKKLIELNMIQNPQEL